MDKTLANHGFTTDEITQLQGAVDIGKLLQILQALGQYAPQVVTLIQTILAAFAKPAPAN